MVDVDKKSRFLEQVEKNQDIVHKICALYAWTDDERKDLSQDIICQLWKSYPSFRGDSQFTTWMYRVALNTALLNVRRNRRRVRTENLEARHDDIPAAHTGPDEHVGIGRLYQAISRLHPFDRAIILLYLEQCSYKDIADVIGISESNVSVRLVRIKKKLKELLS